MNIRFLRTRFTPAAYLSLTAVLCVCSLSCSPKTVKNAASPASAPATVHKEWPENLPVYDHVLIVVEENKDYGQIIGSSDAPYINEVLVKEGANLTRMFAEEHHSEGNYFWLFSGNNQNVGFVDQIPGPQIDAENLGHELFAAKKTFAGYSEDLPEISSPVERSGHYARKHVPWVSFANLPHGDSPQTSSNLRYPQDFPADFGMLPTVCFVIPNQIHDMHDGAAPQSIRAGDAWLRKNVDAYYQWAKTHNSLLIVTFDEDAHGHGLGGLTDPASPLAVTQNRIATILVGAHIRRGNYDEASGVNHVSLLRTLEAMYHLKRAGHQQHAAELAGIKDDAVLIDVFEPSAH